LNSFGGFIGFVVATTISTFFDPRLVFGLIFFLPLFALRVRDVEVKHRKATGGKVTTGLLVLSAAGFFMVFHVAMWSSFLPIYLNSFLPKMQSFLSTGVFLACDSLFFTFVFYISGKVSTKAKGAAMVAATTLVFTSIVSAIPLLPLAPFLLAFLVFRNVVIAFRMIGVAEMVKRRGFGNFQTQFYSTFANSASIFAPMFGGIISDSFGLDYIFYLSAPFGLISSLLFFL
jgi:MFS family permease